MTRQIPIGVSHFSDLAGFDPATGRRQYCFADKSVFIESVIDGSAHVPMLTYPRRFGKTINLSMLEHFLSVSPLRAKGCIWPNLRAE